MRKPALLAFSLPLAAVGTLAGHAAGYSLVGSNRNDALVHGYLAFAPQFLAVCVALVTVSLGLRVTGRLQGRPAPWLFALVPPLAFCAQELIERLVAGLPAHAVFEPAVYVGLAAQLPIAVAAYLVARSLLRVTDAAARVFAQRPDAPLRTPLLLVPVETVGLARTPLAFERLGRAPPPR